MCSARTISDTRLGDAIVEIQRTSRRTYGAPRVTAQLRHQGIRVGKNRVARLMVRRRLVGRGKRRWTTWAPCLAASWARSSCFWIIDSLSPVQLA